MDNASISRWIFGGQKYECNQGDYVLARNSTHSNLKGILMKVQGRQNRFQFKIIALLGLVLLVLSGPHLNAEEVVDIPDPGLEAAIRETLGIPSDPITDTVLGTLPSLSANNRKIKDLTGLEYCMNLHVLHLADNNLRDISPLSGLTSLEFLELSYNKISDIGPLSGLDNLTSLGLSYNNISDLSPLSELATPWFLSLSFNNISNIQPLVDNPEIDSGDHVYLMGNPLSDEALADISTLQDRGVNVYFYTVIEENLIAVIEGWDLPGGTENSLIARLRSANRALLEYDWPTMWKHLYAFIDRCEKMRGKKLTEEQADYLIAEAEWIIEGP
jgi:hypothetical protein